MHERPCGRLNCRPRRDGLQQSRCPRAVGEARTWLTLAGTPGEMKRRAGRAPRQVRERVVLLLPSPTGLPLSSLSTACIRRRPSSPLVQRHACSSPPCAPARHRRPAPRLSARPRPKARLLLHPVRTRAAPPFLLAPPRQPARQSSPPPRHWGSTCDRPAARHGRALACTVPTQRTPPRLPPGGRVRPRRQIIHSKSISSPAPYATHLHLLSLGDDAVNLCFLTRHLLTP